MELTVRVRTARTPLPAAMAIAFAAAALSSLSTASQAQLLNAACQVAYGPDPKGSAQPEPSALWPPSPAVSHGLTLLLGLGLGVGGFALLNRRKAQG
jgi:hypothetical protein